MEEKNVCANCNDLTTNEKHWEYGGYILCDECRKGYDEHEDKTGYCGIHCRCTGNCDESC